MPGVHGDDVQAALALSGAEGAAARVPGLLGDHRVVTDYEDLLRRCPPEALGISPGAHAAVLGPLFGEFE